MKTIRAMKAQRMLIGVLIVGLLLSLAVGLIQAQGPGPGNDADGDETGAVGAVVPIQGRLTDASGNPLNGYYSVRARLYDASTGGTAFCSDTDTVLVDNGLFNMYLDGSDACSASDIDGKQLYLGIKVGSDPEMTPRQGIYPVPYARSLRPGAIISGTVSGAIVHIENWNTNGRALRAYAMATSGTTYGVVGASRSSQGYGGYFYNTAAGDGVKGEGWFGVYGSGTSAGVRGQSTSGHGVYGLSTNGDGVGGSTLAADNNYGFYTPDNLYSLNFHLRGAQMQVVQNGGQETLEPGDVVIFNGLEAGDPPVIQVAKAPVANSTAVAGVVYSRYNIAAVTEDPEHSAKGNLEVTSAGPVPPGEYLLVVIQGPAQVKASALAGAIQSGDLLSSAGPAGQAAKAAQVSIEGVQTTLPGTVFAKALEPLDKGDKLIYVFVTLQ
jgi:hypothetical protein